MQKELKNNRLSINELLCALRSQGIGDINEAEYALLEQNGSISVLERSKSTLAHPVLIDGEIIEGSLRRLGKDEGWLCSQLHRRSLSREQIFLMTVSDDGRISIIEKDRENEN